MTEKRFTIAYNERIEMRQYIDNEKEEPNRWAIWNATETAQKLNAFHEENVELKSALKELKEIGDYQADRIKELQEFEDKVFDSLNGKIKRGKKAIEWGESSGADVGAMGFHIELLKQLKKELEE